MTRNALGRGLGALIREGERGPAVAVPTSATAAAAAPAPESGPGRHLQIDIDLIDTNPFQPRTRFREEALDELARSIAASGVIQPLVVRPAGNRFQLIAGERRWRAAQRAGLSKLPAIVRDVPDRLALEMTLVENIQREDLNPIEQARAFDQLMTEFHLTQEGVAERTGKDRVTVANTVRLLKLEPPLQAMIEEGEISAGHGRALLAVDPATRRKLAQRASRGGLTVRQLERLVSRDVRRGQAKPVSEADANIRSALDDLQKQLATRVSLRLLTRSHPGQLIIEYYTDAQLLSLYDRLMR